MENIKRNYNLDLLRIISMIFVVVLHCCGHGNLLNNVSAFSANGLFLRIIDSFAYVAVNCFVLISGYFLCTSKFKLRKLVVVLVQAIFYSVAIFALISIPKLWGAALFSSLEGCD